MKTGFFEEETGQRSMMRLLSFLSVVGGIAFGGIALFLGRLDSETALFCGGLVVAGLGGKVFQRKSEDSLGGPI